MHALIAVLCVVVVALAVWVSTLRRRVRATEAEVKRLRVFERAVLDTGPTGLLARVGNLESAVVLVLFGPARMREAAKKAR